MFDNILRKEFLIKFLIIILILISGHKSAIAQGTQVNFSTIPKSGTILIYAHLDDDLIWMLPFWTKTEKFIGGVVPASQDYRAIISQQQTFMDNNGYNIDYLSNWYTPWDDVTWQEYGEYYLLGNESYNYLALDHIEKRLYNDYTELSRFEIDKIKAKLEQYFADPTMMRVITHNNWGEYGHRHHIGLNKAVRELAVKYRKDVWMLGCDNGEFNDVTVPNGIEWAYGNFNTPDLYTGIRTIYENYYRWTWSDTYVPSGEHKFIKIVDAGSDKSDILKGDEITYQGSPQMESGAYIFDGNDDYMTLKGNNNPDFTIAMRIRPEEIRDMDICAMSEYPLSTNNDRNLYLESNGNVSATIYDGSSKTMTSTAVISAGTWSHIAITGNGSSFKLYINGVLDRTISSGTAITNYSTPEFILGQATMTGSYFFGQISDVQMYNHMLSNEEIALLAGTTPVETFTIAADAGAGGSINPSGVNVVHKGINRTYSISPDFGYLIQDVKVDNISVGAISQYTFTNIITNHTIAVTFVPLTNLALNKRASSQSYESNNESSKANDFDGSNNSYWSATTYPGWWQVDLGDTYDISYISIRNYVEDDRYYQYNIEASIDGNTYIQIASKTNNNIATDAGDRYTVNSSARFLRVNMTYNSTNQGSQISDFRVFGTMNGKTNLSISGLTADDKTYDGTTEVTLNTGSAVLVGISGGDVVSLISSTATGTFANKNVGTHKEVITSGFILSGADAGKYFLTQPSVTADITALTLTFSGVAANNKVYDGTTLATLNSGSAIITGILEGDNVNLDVSEAKGAFLNKNVGNGKTVNISGLNIYGNDAINYTVYTSVTTTANITKRPVTVTADSESKIYGEDDPAMSFQITYGNLAGTDAFTGALTRDAGENTGSYAITKGTLALSSNYDLTYISANLNINTRSVTIKADSRSKIYGDSDPLLTYHVTSGSLARTDSFTGALTRTAGENIGSYAITKGTVALNSNYILSYSGANLIINARPVTITADSRSKIYGDSNPALTYRVTSGNLVGTDVFTGALTRTAGENIGTYAITKGTVALNSNYILSYSGANLIINARPVTIMADSRSKIYGDSDPALTYRVTSGNLAGTDSFTGALTRTAGENTGIYTITKGTVALNSNYTLSYSGANFIINARSVIIMADEKSKEYGESDPELTYISDPAVGSPLTKGEPITFTGTLSRVPGETSGTYAILKNTLNNSNYNITYIGSNLTINLGTAINPITKTEFGVKAYPNPFTDHLYFDLQWGTNAKARIEIFNTVGIKLATIFSDNIEANQIYRLEYSPENIKTGILFYRLFINDKLMYTGKLIHL